MQLAKNFALVELKNPQFLSERGHCLTFEVTTNQNKTMTNLLSPSEIFKPIIGYEGLYEVSNFGRIKSLSRTTTKGRIIYDSIKEAAESLGMKRETLSRQLHGQRNNKTTLKILRYATY